MDKKDFFGNNLYLRDSVYFIDENKEFTKGIIIKLSEFKATIQIEGTELVTFKYYSQIIKETIKE